MPAKQRGNHQKSALSMAPEGEEKPHRKPKLRFDWAASVVSQWMDTPGSPYFTRTFSQRDFALGVMSMGPNLLYQKRRFDWQDPCYTCRLVSKSWKPRKHAKLSVVTALDLRFIAGMLQLQNRRQRSLGNAPPPPTRRRRHRPILTLHTTKTRTKLHRNLLPAPCQA